MMCSDMTSNKTELCPNDRMISDVIQLDRTFRKVCPYNILKYLAVIKPVQAELGTVSVDRVFISVNLV
jgi:hypothetical protein